ncbi:MAG: hypothetical protein V4617_15135 [Gemmatimonadota bacterium]
MSLASLRTRRVAIGAYSAPVDAESAIAVDTYTKVASGDDDGLWWAARGTRSGMQTAPTGAAQHVTQVVYAFDTEVPVTPDGIVIDGDQRLLITSVLPRDVGRDELQVLAVHVDDADAAFQLVGF